MQAIPIACAILTVLLAANNGIISVRASECSETDVPALCHGARVVRSVATMQPFRLMDGVEIVRIVAQNGSDGDSTTRSRSDTTTGYGYVDRVLQYMQSHEIKINVHDVLQKSGVVDAMSRAIKEIESENEVVEARKKGKGSGLSTVLITALMMKKLLAALGMGAIAALSAKALGVATLSLILSVLMGLKKLSEPQPTMKTQYIHADHRRKRRDLADDDDDEVPLPYRAWAAAL